MDIIATEQYYRWTPPQQMLPLQKIFAQIFNRRWTLPLQRIRAKLKYGRKAISMTKSFVLLKTEVLKMISDRKYVCEDQKNTSLKF